MKNFEAYSKLATVSSDYRIVTKKFNLALRGNQQKNDKIKRYNWSELTHDSHFRHLYTMERAYFRKSGHAWGMTKRGHVSVNLGQFEDETPLNCMQI